MKTAFTILAFLALMGFYSPVFSQEFFIHQTALRSIDAEIVEVVLSYIGGSGYCLLVDYGQPCDRLVGKLRDKQCKGIVDESGRLMFWSSRVGALDALAKQGWQLVGMMDTDDMMPRYYFTRKDSKTN
ncbi:MAG: hypothetical protein NWR72_06345 [Bacteroidia bacterium]|nr:hypothetical protein [Bacteroidia bacterium]